MANTRHAAVPTITDFYFHRVNTDSRNQLFLWSLNIGSWESQGPAPRQSMDNQAAGLIAVTESRISCSYLPRSD